MNIFIIKKIIIATLGICNAQFESEVFKIFANTFFKIKKTTLDFSEHYFKATLMAMRANQLTGITWQ